MNCPARSDHVKKELCNLFYPYGCGSKCTHVYKRWCKEVKEVRVLEGLEEE